MRELGRGYQEGDEGGGPWVVSEQWGSKTQGCTLVGVGDLFLGDKWWVSLQRPELLCVCVCVRMCVCVCVTHSACISNRHNSPCPPVTLRDQPGDST